MAVSEAQRRAQKKYDKANFDLINFKIRKGKRELYKAAADELKLSLSRLLQLGAEEYIVNHAGAEFVKALQETGEAVVPFEKPAEKELSAQEQLLLARFNRLPQETKDVVLNLVGEAARVANKGANEDGD